MLLSDILEKEEITHISSDDLEIFIESLHGDMRRGLTELQAVTYSKSSILNQINKNQEPYTEILQMIDENNYENSLGKVHDLLYESVDMKTICIIYMMLSSRRICQQPRSSNCLGLSERQRGVAI